MTRMIRAAHICTLIAVLLIYQGDARFNNQNRPPPSGQQGGPQPQQGQRSPQHGPQQGQPQQSQHGQPQQGQQQGQSQQPQRGQPHQDQRPQPPGQPQGSPQQAQQRPGQQQPQQDQAGQPQSQQGRPQPQPDQLGQPPQNPNDRSQAPDPASGSNPFQGRDQRPPPPGWDQRPPPGRHQRPPPPGRDQYPPPGLPDPVMQPLSQSNQAFESPEIVDQNPIQQDEIPANVDFFGGGVPPDMKDELIPPSGVKLPGSLPIMMSEEEMEEKVGDMVYEMLEVLAEEQHQHHGGSTSILKTSSLFCSIVSVVVIELFNHFRAGMIVV